MRLLSVLGWLWLVGLLVAAAAGGDVRRHHLEAAGLTLGLGLVLLLSRVREKSKFARSLSGSNWSWHAVIPAAVALVAFGWSVTLGPLSDDFILQRWSLAGDLIPVGWEYVRPVPLAVWSGVLAVGGQWVALHVLNVALHVFNAVLVFRICTLLLGRNAGLVASVVFAAFPASAEAIAWTAGVFDLSATACTLGATLVWLTVESSGKRIALLCLLLFLGLMCKESAIAIPGLLFVFALMSFGPVRGLRANAAVFACLLAVVAAVLIARGSGSSDFQEVMVSLPRDNRALKDLVVRPFACLAVPVRTDDGVGLLAYFTGGAGLLFVGMLIAQLWPRLDAADDGKRASTALVALAWIGVAALPLLMQFGVGADLEGSRYLYTPSFGFALLIASAMPTARRIPLVLFSTVLALLLASYGAGLVEARDVWREAARTRDTLLRQAAAFAGTNRCSSLRVLDAPDNVRGAYVFHVGIDEALRPIGMTAGGPPCTVRWFDDALAADGDSNAPIR